MCFADRGTKKELTLTNSEIAGYVSWSTCEEACVECICLQPSFTRCFIVLLDRGAIFFIEGTFSSCRLSAALESSANIFLNAEMDLLLLCHTSLVIVTCRQLSGSV